MHFFIPYMNYVSNVLFLRGLNKVFILMLVNTTHLKKTYHRIKCLKTILGLVRYQNSVGIEVLKFFFIIPYRYRL